MANMFPNYMFGNYIIELAKLFKYKFINFQLDPSAKITPLQIYYGTPKAAFRYWLKTFNGKMVLPAINFYGIDYRRRYDKECPNAKLPLSDRRSYDPVTKTVAVTIPPMHFDVTYQFSLYNNNRRERDMLYHKIIQIFTRGQCSLRWFPDPSNYPDIFLYMPLKMDESFTDDTEIEGLAETETLDVIKTNFNIISSAVVPYEVLRIPTVQKIILDNVITDYDEHGTVVVINQRIEESTQRFSYFAESYNKINIRGETYIEFNGKIYGAYSGFGKGYVKGTCVSNFTKK